MEPMDRRTGAKGTDRSPWTARVVEQARRFLNKGGAEARREIVRLSLELDRLLR